MFLLLANGLVGLGAWWCFHKEFSPWTTRERPECLWTFYQAAIAGGIGLTGLLVRRHWFLFLVASSAGLASLWLPWSYAMSGWPGGDDGGGLAWLFLGGGACVFNSLAGLTTLGLGLWVRRKAHRPPTGPA